MYYFLQGLTLGLAYVAPIGVQNLFVINAAMTQSRRRALLTALKQLLHSVPESRRIIRVKTPVNVVNSAVAAEEYVDGGLYEVSTDDSEGFNDPV